MAFESIAEIMVDAERRAILAGVPCADVRPILLRAEAELVKALAKSEHRERQFLLDLRENGANAMAERMRISRAQVYLLRKRALNKVSNLAISAQTKA